MGKVTQSTIASTKYNDWKGSISLDNEHKDIAAYFKEWIGDQHILGVKADIDPEYDEVTVDLTIYTGMVDRDEKGKRIDRKFPEVKAYTKEISLAEFLKLFKRINIKFFEDLDNTKNIKIIETIKMK